MNKRILRTVLALATGGLLISPLVATPASAQTTVNPGTITGTARFNPTTPPSGVTGVSLFYDCRNFVTGAAVNLPSGSPNNPSPVGSFTTFGNATITAASGGSFVTNIGLTGNNGTTGATGTTCAFRTRIEGTANVGTPTVVINVGGSDRTITAGTATNAAGTAGAATATTAEIPVFGSTDVLVTVTFPAITVRKVIVGEEANAGFAYPMTISCTSGGTVGALTTAGAATGIPSGRWISVAIRNTDRVNDVQLYAIADSSASAADVATITTAVANAAVIVQPGTAANLDALFGAFGSERTSEVRADGTGLGAGGLAATFPGSNAAFARSSYSAFLAALRSSVGSGTVLAPVNTTANPFNGLFTLAGGATRTFTSTEFPGLSGTSVCEVVETNSGGMPVTLYSSSVASTTTNRDPAPLPGVGGTTGTGTYRSALTGMGQTVTVTNASYGDLVISKVVTGDPKTNIATYEVSVSCDKGGPKDTFLLKDRQSKVYQNILTGTNCLITETKSDGATASYADNSGDNTTDGRVVIKRRGTGCTAPGSPTSASPGGPAPTTAFDECWANVIITNSYVPVTTTAAPTTTGAPTTTAAPALAPTPAPAPAVVDEPTFTG